MKSLPKYQIYPVWKLKLDEQRAGKVQIVRPPKDHQKAEDKSRQNMDFNRIAAFIEIE